MQFALAETSGLELADAATIERQGGNSRTMRIALILIVDKS